MLSRVANNLYWAGRYIERAENTARLINVTTYLLLDLPRQTDFDWRPLVEINGAEAFFDERYPAGGELDVMRFLILDPLNPTSIRQSLALARDNLRTTRDIVPREAWEEINELYNFLSGHGNEALARRRRQGLLDRVLRCGRMVAGLLDSGMSRDAAYEFLQLGVNIERADMTTRIVDVRTEDLLEQARDGLPPFQSLQWLSMLRSLSGYQMYRRHVRSRVSGPRVLGFLLQNQAFPRSVRFCIEAAEKRLARLPDGAAGIELCRRAEAMLGEASMASLIDHGLSDFLDQVQRQLISLQACIDATYFGMRVEAEA